MRVRAASGAAGHNDEQPNELIFGRSGGGHQQLISNYSDGGAPAADTPEPRSMLLLSAALAAFATLRRR